MVTTDEVLEQRGAIYGDFFEGIVCEADLLSIITDRYWKQHGTLMPRHYYLYFSKIAMKLSRLSVCPDHIDSWTDIAGYARLVELQLNKNKGNTDATSTEITNASVATNAHTIKIREKDRSDSIHESAGSNRRSDSSCADGC